MTIRVELRFQSDGWIRMQGSYGDADQARRDIAAIYLNWRGRENAPTGHRIIRIAEETIEEVTDD